MIIVSQDESQIINFNNITNFYINNNTKDKIYEIKCLYINGIYDTLGKYKTKERAKEVLKEITNYYTRQDYQEKQEALVGIGIIFNRINGLFYMPKE